MFHSRFFTSLKVVNGSHLYSTFYHFFKQPKVLYAVIAFTLTLIHQYWCPVMQGTRTNRWEQFWGSVLLEFSSQGHFDQWLGRAGNQTCNLPIERRLLHQTSHSRPEVTRFMINGSRSSTPVENSLLERSPEGCQTYGPRPKTHPSLALFPLHSSGTTCLDLTRLNITT